MHRAILPSRAAPAVCELDGPIITGPIISKNTIHTRLYIHINNVRKSYFTYSITIDID